MKLLKLTHWRKPNPTVVVNWNHIAFFVDTESPETGDKYTEVIMNQQTQQGVPVSLAVTESASEITELLNGLE